MDLHAARGGRVGFQMLLRGLNGRAAGELVQRRPQPEVFQLIDVNVPENSGPPCSAIPPNQATPKYVIRKAPYRVYEALRPFRDGDPVRAESDALYVSFRIPSNAPPGERPGLLQVRAGGQTAEIAVKLTIHKATVPEQGHLRVTNWFSTVHMARLHKVEPWSEAHWDMIHQYALMMRRGRQTDFMPIGPEEKKIGEGQWKFDFTRTERMIRMFLGAGFTHIELPHVARHDRRKEAVAPFVVSVDGTPKPGTSHEAYEYLAQALTAWGDMLHRNGWYDRATQHVVDEPSPKVWRLSHHGRHCSQILPGVPLIDALGKPELDAAVDIWCRSVRVTRRGVKPSKRIAVEVTRSGSPPAVTRAG
jgi:hypothetical protein